MNINADRAVAHAGFAAGISVIWTVGVNIAPGTAPAWLLVMAALPPAVAGVSVAVQEAADRNDQRKAAAIEAGRARRAVVRHAVSTPHQPALAARPASPARVGWSELRRKREANAR